MRIETPSIPADSRFITTPVEESAEVLDRMVQITVDESPTPDTVSVHIYVVAADTILKGIQRAVEDFRIQWGSEVFIKGISAEFIDEIRVI